ncbi:hypothetical protein MNBD_GAMMA15-1979 [hydrothermal vent metagenome]|uniref:Uncharacterized protein n=1 Tax=hydrothermal vent metagenome TaxID=652676 RepID=A0A3B0YEJ7_9ZZZZ
MSFLDKHLEKTVIRLDFQNETGEYLSEAEEITDEVVSWIINKIEDLQELIAVISGLIVYLKNNGYIASYGVTPNKWSQKHDFGKGIQEDLKISTPFPDEEITKLLIEYAFKEIVPLEPLTDLEEHEFTTQDERRFIKQYKQTQKSIKLAKSGVITAIFIGVFGIIFNIIALNNQSDSSSMNATLYRNSSDAVIDNLDKLSSIGLDRNAKLDRLIQETKNSSNIIEKDLGGIKSDIKN